MNKKILGGFLLAAITAFCVPFVNFASAVTVSENADSPQSMTIHRYVHGVTNPVTNTFTYSITEDPNNPAKVSNLPESATIEFDAVQPSNGLATKSTVLDLSGVGFSALGDYKFHIKEISSSNSNTYPKSNKEYIAMVSVRNEVDENGKPTGNFIPTLVAQARDAESGDKTEVVFESSAKFTYIEISKEVTGNLGESDRYFLFSLSVNGASKGDKFVIEGQDDEIVVDGQTVQPSKEYVVGESNKIYLKHGQTITIGKSGDLAQMPIGLSYALVEATPAGYTTFINGVEKSSTGWLATAAMENGEITEANKIKFVNNRGSAVLTGITSAIAPIAVLAVLGVCGLAITRKLRKSGR